MKKIIIVGIVTFIVGATISPIAGMAISSTRNLILGMAPEEAILVLADKIDEESGRNDEQEQKLFEQNEKMAVLTNNQEVASCKQKKKECEDKIYNLTNGEVNIYSRGKKLSGDRGKMIEQLNDDIAQAKRLREDAVDQNYKSGIEQFQKDIDDASRDIIKLREIIARENLQKEVLLSGECKDYQNPCE